MLQILIVEDEEKLAKLMAQALKESERTVEYETNATAAVKRLDRGERFDIVLTDMRMQNETDGMRVLESAIKQRPLPAVIVITAHATVETAVEAMRKGAFNYLQKPIKMDELAIVVEKAAEHLQLRRENQDLRVENLQLREALDKHFKQEIIGDSPEIQEALRIVRRVAPVRSTVLIRGESGTGKELIARALHYGSPRMNGPFIKVNCAAIPSGLLESELFGHVRGAFTGAVANHTGKFELADKGSIFLDEIGEIPIELQTKLLRVLQESEFEKVGGKETLKVDIRIIAATNRNLEQAIKDGRFREDLYYRLNVVEIHVPPLSKRQGDVQRLIEHFLGKFAAVVGVDRKELSPEASAALLQYSWPGNIRELENAIEHAVVISEGPEIQLADLPFSIRRAVEKPDAKS